MLVCDAHRNIHQKRNPDQHRYAFERRTRGPIFLLNLQITHLILNARIILQDDGVKPKRDAVSTGRFPLKTPNGVTAFSPTLFVETAAPRTMLGNRPPNPSTATRLRPC